MNKLDWFASKTDKEWEEYWFSRPMPLSEEDELDLQDYTVWRVGKSLVEDNN
jgi:hypothetical protein